jgi:hypothetical protein
MPEKGSMTCALEGGRVVLRRRVKPSPPKRGADTAPKTPTMSIVRRLFPQAPEIASTTMIYLGVGKTAGRIHHTVVAGPDDIAHKAVVLGYTIRIGDTGPFRPPGVLVTVKLLNRCKLIPPVETAYADCLQGLSDDK